MLYSLKEKRRSINRIYDRMRNAVTVSVSELDFDNNHKKALFKRAPISTEGAQVNKVLS
ncbi:DUF503 family protein [Chlamydiota bacterium]